MLYHGLLDLNHTVYLKLCSFVISNYVRCVCVFDCVRRLVRDIQTSEMPDHSMNHAWLKNMWLTTKFSMYSKIIHLHFHWVHEKINKDRLDSSCIQHIIPRFSAIPSTSINHQLSTIIQYQLSWTPHFAASPAHLCERSFWPGPRSPSPSIARPTSQRRLLWGPAC